MSECKICLKKRLPPALLTVFRSRFIVYALFKRCVAYQQQDSTAYWKTRALGKGQSRVLWQNEEYNQLYRAIQKSLVEKCVVNMNHDTEILDIGCGIGIVSRMLTEINPNVRIDAVDFPEMIKIAKTENPGRQINYIKSSAENYFDSNKRYKFIISSGCFSAIRDIKAMETAISNCTRMLETGGIILMIDPFHRWNYLARVKYSSRQIVRFMKKQGATLTWKSGVLFWPYREWLAMSACSGGQLEKRFLKGERLLGLLGKHFWADYKILAFKKTVSQDMR